MVNFSRKYFLVSLVIFAITIMLLTFLVPNFSNSYASTAQKNYFYSYFKSYSDGRVEKGLQIGVDYSLFDTSEIETFKNKLLDYLRQSQLEEKQQILEKYNPDVSEYNPDNSVSFEEPYFNAKEVGYRIVFNSFSTYSYYYNDVQRKLNKGFMVSSLEQKISSPFSKIMENGEKYGEVLLKEIVKLTQGFSAQTSFEDNFKPILQFDFITYNNRVKSNADMKGIDEDGYYHYMWLSGEQGSKEILTIKLTIVHKGWWYLFAILIPLCIMTIAIIITLVKSKKTQTIKKTS